MICLVQCFIADGGQVLNAQLVRVFQYVLMITANPALILAQVEFANGGTVPALCHQVISIALLMYLAACCFDTITPPIIIMHKESLFGTLSEFVVSVKPGLTSTSSPITVYIRESSGMRHTYAAAILAACSNFGAKCPASSALGLRVVSVTSRCVAPVLAPHTSHALFTAVNVKSTMWSSNGFDCGFILLNLVGHKHRLARFHH